MERKLRLITGLTLFAYVACHLIGHMTGLFGLAAMDSVGRKIVLAPWETLPGHAAFYGSLLVHAALGLRALYRRRHFRIPTLEAWQLALGLTIPLFLAPHFADVRLGADIYGLDESYYRILYRIWIAFAAIALPRQLILLTLVWTHGCIGLHFWLRHHNWYVRWRYFLLAGAISMPFLAVLGVVNAGWDAAMSAKLQPGFAAAHAPPAPGTPGATAEDALDAWGRRIQVNYGALVVLVLLARVIRGRRERGGAVRITYPNGRVVAAPRGFSVLEASRWAQIPHVSICGGRGRCSTCRVRILAGAEAAPEPSTAELETLERVKAPPMVRLACQLRPVAPISVAPLLSFPDPGQGPRRADGESRESLVTALFIDLRDSTRLAAGRLPFDALFIVDRYVHRVTDAIEAQGGVVISVAGDGIMSVFGARSDPLTGARGALRAVGAAWDAIDALSRDLAGELDRPLAFGAGLHAGVGVVGTVNVLGRPSLQFLGDAANFASRLEAATKEFKCVCVVSEAVFNVAGMAAPADLARQDLTIRGLENRTLPVVVVRERAEADFESAGAEAAAGL